MVQTHSQLTKSPFKGSRYPNEQQKIMQRNPRPSSSKSPNKYVSIRVQNTSIMSYNVFNHLHKMEVTLLIMEVMKIPQEKENIFKFLEEENLKENKIEAVVMTQKPQPNRGWFLLFCISSEIDDIINHNCMVNCGVTHNIMPLLIMRTIGSDCNRHYEARECIFSID